MTSRTAPAPFIPADGEVVDLLASFETVRVRYRNLRPGMLLVDDFGCPIAALDHRVDSSRQGGGRWLVEVLDRDCFPAALYGSCHWVQIYLGPSTPVAAR